MTIKLSKFGEMLISRPAGREAYFSLGKNPGMVEFDFDKIKVLTPSWIDEFIALLKNDFPKTKIKFLHSHNPTVISSLKIISASPSA